MFKVGDRVRCTFESYGAYCGVGTILKVEPREVHIKFDRYDSNLHNLKGLCEDGYGWIVIKSYVIPAEIKVKPTRLAKKIYPNAKEEDGYLLIEE